MSFISDYQRLFISIQYKKNFRNICDRVVDNKLLFIKNKSIIKLEKTNFKIQNITFHLKLQLNLKIELPQLKYLFKASIYDLSHLSENKCSSRRNGLFAMYVKDTYIKGSFILHLIQKYL